MLLTIFYVHVDEVVVNGTLNFGGKCGHSMLEKHLHFDRSKTIFGQCHLYLHSTEILLRPAVSLCLKNVKILH